MASMNLILWLTVVSTVLIMLVIGFFQRIHSLYQLLLNSVQCAIYHFSVGVQRRRSVFNSHIAWAISWESGLPMTLIPSQFKESMCFDLLY